jgi:hypothetical protein
MTKDRDEFVGPPRQVRFPHRDNDIIQRRVDAGETASDVIRQLVAAGIFHGAAYQYGIPAIELEIHEQLLLARALALSGNDLTKLIKSLVLNEAHRTLNAHDERLRTAALPSGKAQP